MLDIIGAMSLTAGAAIVIGVLAFTATRGRQQRTALILFGSSWFTLVAILAALGVFTQPAGLGTLAIGAAVMIPVVAALVALGRSPAARSLLLGMPAEVLVALNAGRG